MGDENLQAIKALRTGVALLAWYGLGVASGALAISRVLAGIIYLVLVGALVFVLIDGRLFRRFEKREIPGTAIAGLYFAIALVVYFIIKDLRLNDLYILGQLHIPAAINLVQAAGAAILAALLFWETVGLTRARFAGRR